MIVCLAANPSVDRLFEVERLVKGDIHRPSGFVQVAGGKGLNVARAARSLGADVCVVALLGTHGSVVAGIPRRRRRGGRVRLDPGRAGPRCRSPTVRPPDSPSSTSTVPSPRTPRGSSSPTPPRCDGNAGWLTISGSLPRGAPDEGYRDLIEEARRGGVRIAGFEGERLRLALTAEPDIVKVNIAEAGAPRRADGTPGRLLAAASKIRDMAGGDGHAGIVTRGRRA